MKIDVLIVKPNEEPKQEKLNNTLEAFQNVVGGWIQIVRPFKDKSIGLVCNEEGKILNLPPNRRIQEDIIAGTFVLVGLAMGEDGEDFTSLTIEQLIQMYIMFELSTVD